MTKSIWARLSVLASGFALLCTGARASIENYAFSTTRGVGLGGAYSALVDDASAAIVNPAALGFMSSETESAADNNALGEQNFGWTILDLGASATLTGDLGDYLETLANTDFSKFGSGNLQSPENIKSLIEMAGALGSVSDRDTIVVNADAGTMVHFGRFAFGVRTFGQVGGWINELDLVNLGLSRAADQIADELNQAMISEGFDPTNYTPRYLTGDNFDKMRDSFGNNPSNDNAIAYIDYKLGEAVQENGLDEGNVQGAVDTLAEVIAASDVGGELTDNQTSITGRGFFALEAPLSYGYALNENFSVGLTAKLIFGRVYGTQVWAFNEDNEQILEDSLDSSVDRVNVGLDAAMMYRIPKWQFAFVGHNLNGPRFDGYDQTFDINGTPQTVTVPDVVLDPQLTAAVAWIPLRRFALAAETELLETGTLLNGYDVQRISFGSELDLSLLALRLGTYRNIAESDLGWVLTGGVGFNLWAVSVDVGGAISIDDTVKYNGTDYPRTLRLNAGLSMNF